MPTKGETRKRRRMKEKPKNCYYCEHCVNGNFFMYRCELADSEFEFIQGERKSYCPLDMRGEE